jgi:hypothetical protein
MCPSLVTLLLAMRKIRILTAIVGSALVLSACSSGRGKATETTTTTTTTTAAPATTVASTTTTPTTAPTTAASTPTTAASTTTTTAGAVDQTAAIKQAFLDYEAIRYACLQQPASCDPLTYARGKRVGSERELIERVVGLHAHARRQENDASYWTLRSVQPSPDGTTAQVKACYWSTDIIEIDGGAIFNDEKVSYEQTIDLIVEDGRWWISYVFTDQRTPDVNSCGPRQ